MCVLRWGGSCHPALFEVVVMSIELVYRKKSVAQQVREARGQKKRKPMSASALMQRYGNSDSDWRDQFGSEVVHGK